MRRKPGMFRTPGEALAAFGFALLSGAVVVIFIYGAVQLVRAW